MFATVGLLELLNSQNEDRISILILGLDNSGKTTILRSLNKERTDNIKPTQGFNVKTIIHSGYRLALWDLGGSQESRVYWKNYYERTIALIYVIDSSDRVKLENAQTALHSILLDKNLFGVPLLVFSNKSDDSHSLSVSEVSEIMKLSSVVKRSWNIVSCSAIHGHGLHEGVKWLVKAIHE